MVNGDIYATFVCFVQFKMHVAILEQDKSRVGCRQWIADMFLRLEHMFQVM